MRTGPLRHRDVGAKASAQLDLFFECTDCGEVLIINDRQLFPGAPLRDHVAGRIPARQSRQNLSIVFADHASYRPVLATCHVVDALPRQPVGGEMKS